MYLSQRNHFTPRPASLIRLLALLLPVVITILSGRVSAGVYQWSTSVDIKPTSPVDEGYPRAFLWIPPNCQKVRAIVLSQNNMEEESILEDDTFRQTLSDLGFAEVWVTPNLGSPHFRFDQGAGDVLATVLKNLAAVSGYQELETAPLVPIGHSASAGFGWDIAAWNPGRTLAVLSISGQWPYYTDKGPGTNVSPVWGDRTVDGVPGLTTKGEFEIQGDTNGWYFHLKGDSLAKHPKTVFTQVVEPGGGHFDASADKIALICLYLRKAAKYRLPSSPSSDGTVNLTPIDPTTMGWLLDEWHLNQEPHAAAAPVADYTGVRQDAVWAFDEEMARAIETFQGKERNKANVLIGFRQSPGLTTPRPDHGMVHLKFEPQADGVTFKLTGGFWDTVPPTTNDKRPEWAGWLSETNTTTPLNPGDAINHPQNADDKITLSRITGPVLQTAPDTFVIHPYRIGSSDARKSNDIWLVASYPGDDTYKAMVQQAELQFPITNKSGTAQTLTFPSIPDKDAAAAPFQLEATSSANLPVSYYVREGPAVVSLDGTVTLSPIPPRSKYPLKVTIVATQWGRSIDPKIQTATPVEQSFSVTASAAHGQP